MWDVAAFLSCTYECTWFKSESIESPGIFPEDLFFLGVGKIAPFLDFLHRILPGLGMGHIRRDHHLVIPDALEHLRKEFFISLAGEVEVAIF